MAIHSFTSISRRGDYLRPHVCLDTAYAHFPGTYRSSVGSRDIADNEYPIDNPVLGWAKSIFLDSHCLALPESLVSVPSRTTMGRDWMARPCRPAVADSSLPNRLGSTMGTILVGHWSWVNRDYSLLSG